MVHRKRTTARPSALIDPKWNKLKKDLLQQLHQHNINSGCYRDTTIDTLCKQYSNKCAICERKRGMELQIDHYRPFKKRNNTSNSQYNQPGYYWLAYTWSNLLPLCSKCNLAKSNKFPLSGWTNANRITSHNNISNLALFKPYDLSWLQQQEQPLLIHPELEKQPIKHFIFSNKGTIRGRTPQGKETIRVCKLNRRQLKHERHKIIQGYAQSIKKAIDKFVYQHKNGERFKGELEGTFELIKSHLNEDEAFSMLHIYIYKYFDYFIGSFLPKNIRGKITSYFRAFISNETT